MGRKGNYKKGLKLEQEFAEFLTTEMNYGKVKIRSQIKAAENSRGSNIDIIGERPNKKGERMKRLANSYLIIFFAMFGGGLIIGYSNNWGVGIWTLLITVSIIFEAGALIALFISKSNDIVNAWVECKNLKGKANINQVRKMIDEMSEYKASGDKRYKFYDFIFVSANGFIDNAIQLAERNNIQCYVKHEESFKQVTEWS